MTLFEFPFWKRWGMEGVAEWQSNRVILSKLTRGNSKSPRGPRISWTIGLHLFHGVVAGIVFGLLLPFLVLLPGGGFSVLLDAVTYSVALWIIFMLAPRRAFESASGMPNFRSRPVDCSGFSLGLRDFARAYRLSHLGLVCSDKPLIQQREQRVLTYRAVSAAPVGRSLDSPCL
jgi:hypothetical protein